VGTRESAPLNRSWASCPSWTLWLLDQAFVRLRNHPEVEGSNDCAAQSQRTALTDRNPTASASAANRGHGVTFAAT
jgi:hypothetical protein